MKMVIGKWSACLAAVALAGCATGGAAPNASKSTATAATGTAASPAGTTTTPVPSEYTLVRKDGTDFYCRKEKVTGSRTRTADVCLTKAQLDAKERGVDSLLQDMRDTKPQSTSMDGNGGRTNTAVGQ